MKKEIYINEKIPYNDFLVIDIDKKSLGTMSKNSALELAESRELDLILINQMPTVVKICKADKYLYELKKSEKQKQKNQTIIELKKIPLTIMTDKRDLDIKIKKAISFLNENNKVMFTIRIRKREQTKINQKNDQISLLKEKLLDIAIIEREDSTNNTYAIIFMKKKK